jgi:hypothetical protein
MILDTVLRTRYPYTDPDRRSEFGVRQAFSFLLPRYLESGKGYFFREVSALLLGLFVAKEDR